MLTVREFNQLIGILPNLEEFARAHELTSLSLVKTPDPERAEADLYLCYTHAGDEHALDKMAVIGRKFSQLWGLPRFSNIVDAQDKQGFNENKFEQQLKPTEIFLLKTNPNGVVETATPDQVAEYAKRIFDIICDPSVTLPQEHSDMSKKRKVSEEKKDVRETVSVSTSNIFNRASPETPIKKIEEAIDRLSEDDFKQLMINISRKHDITNIIEIFPRKKPN